MEPEICTKMLKKLSEKFSAKFPATTRGYSMVRIARLDDAFLTAIQPGIRSIAAAKRKKRRKRKAKNIFKKLKSLKT